MSQRTRSADEPINVLRKACPTAKVSLPLPLALIEEIDQARGQVPRSTYLAMVIDAALTREDPHLPQTSAAQHWIDAMASRSYRRHVRSIALERAR
ncbi:MAG: hypothetical protein ACR2LV_05475 [Solirubrobacteraceae bacterium]